MRGVALILNHPISTVCLSMLMSSLVLAKEVMVSSKISRDGLLVETPPRILMAIQLKVSSTSSSPSSLTLTCLCSFGSSPVFKKFWKLSERVSFQRNSLSLYWSMNSLVASWISRKFWEKV